MALVSDGFEKLRVSLKGIAGILNAYTELLPTILVPSQ